MTSAFEHGQTILAAIIPDRRDLLDKTLRHLVPEHFVDPVHRNLFLLLERYFERTGAVLTRSALGDLLASARADSGKFLNYVETFELLAAKPVDDSEFTWSLHQIRELAADRATGVALTEAMEILTRGQTNEQGEVIRGHAEARAAVLHRFAEIDRSLAMQEAPEGDMRTEADDILADYALRKSLRLSNQSAGINFGIPPLDDKIGGINPAELVLAAAYTNEGKTSLMVQLAWHAAVVQGRNVVVLTTETIRSQVRRRVIARHSCVEHFGLKRGLNSRQIKDGSLTPEQEKVLAAVVHDFETNPGYGTVYIVQVPRGATVGYVESKLVRIQRQFPIDLAIMDYLALLRPERRRNSEREELGGMLKEAKQVCTTFNDGAGIPIVSPWQVNRTARAEAERLGGYTSAGLAETAEASNSADLIISLLAPLDNDSRIANLKMQVLKNRDGEKASSIDVLVDYATSHFSVAAGRDAQGQAFDDFGV